MARSLAIVQGLFPNVKKIVDAKQDTIIEVTKKDCASATARNHKACAMSVACKRKLHLDGVIMSISTSYLVKNETATRYMVPSAVSREITAFDRNARFEPGTYMLKAPKGTNKLNSGRHGSVPEKRTPDSKGNFAKRFHHKTGGVRASLGSRGVV